MKASMRLQLVATYSAMAFLAACGGGGGSSDGGTQTVQPPAPGDTTPPTVLSTNLTDGQKGSSDTTSVRATFSEGMDPTTLNTTTFTLVTTSGGSPVSGTVSYDAASNSARFSPAAPLAGNTQFTATITTGATDLAGNGLAASFTLSFTTATSTYRVLTQPSAVATSLQGSVVLVDPSNPGTAIPPFAAIVNPANFAGPNDENAVAYVASGTFDTSTHQIADRHRHAVVFSNGGKLFGLSTVITGTTPAPVQISNLSTITAGPGDGSVNAAATDLCAIFAAEDYANVDNSLIVPQQAGPDKICGNTDDTLLVTQFGASASTAPITLPAGTLPEMTIYNVGTGAIGGVLALNSSGALVNLSGAGLATSALVNGGTGPFTDNMEPLMRTADGRTIVRVANTIRVYLPPTSSINPNTLSAALVTLSQAAGVRFASDGTNFFFADNVVAGTNVIQKITFPSGLAPIVNATFHTGAAGAFVNVSAATRDQLIFQENGTVKSIPKAGGTAVTVIAPVAGINRLDVVGVTNTNLADGTPAPVKVYANAGAGVNPSTPGSGTWTALVADEDGSNAEQHANSRWMSSSFGTTINNFGNQRFARQLVLLTRATAASDDQGAALSSYFAPNHSLIASLGTVSAPVAFVGNPSSNTSLALFMSGEFGGAKLLLQGTRIGALTTPADVFFVDPLVANSFTKVGNVTPQVPLDFRDFTQ